MTAHVRAPQKLSARAFDLESIKVEVAAAVRETVEKLLSEQLAIQTDRSVSGFCRRWGFSRFLFYDRIDEMPAVMHVGGRTLISPAAEELWIKQREAAAKVAPKRLVGKARAAEQIAAYPEQPP
jgi:hypothetical protein